MIKELAKKTTEIVTSEEVKKMGKFSKEARQMRKLQKLGAVSLKDFESLKSNVEIQKYGFAAIAAIEGIRLVKGLTKKPVEDTKAETLHPIHYSMSEEEIDAVATALLDKMNIIVDNAGGLPDPEEEPEESKGNSSDVDDLPDEIVEDDLEENG